MKIDGPLKRGIPAQRSAGDRVSGEGDGGEVRDDVSVDEDRRSH
jgi:hypothetical protein